jgi:hypothetical protein
MEGIDVKGVDLGQVSRELDKGQVHNNSWSHAPSRPMASWGCFWGEPS